MKPENQARPGSLSRHRIVVRLWIRRHPRFWPALAACATLVAVLRIALTIPVFNNTFDEPFHLAATVSLYDMHKLIYGVEHPPVTRLVAGLGLYLSGIHLPPQYRSLNVEDEKKTMDAGVTLMFDNGQLTYWQMLNRIRYPMLIFPVLAMLYLYRLAKWLAGRIVAALAVVFFSLDPTLLGHGVWLCTDVAGTAGFLAALYYGCRWAVHGGTGRAAIAGIAIALAVASKFSTAVAVPIIGIVLIIQLIRQRPIHLVSRIGQIMVILVVGFFTLWATYLFDVGRLADQTRFGPDKKDWVRIPLWIRQARIPMPSFPLGLMWLGSHSRSGHPEYLNGQVGLNGWWYYFPEAIALKSPLGFLAAIGLAGATVALRRGVPRRAWLIALAGIIFLLPCMLGKINIGIRHILPVLPLLYLLVCWQLALARWGGVLIVCMIVAAVETATAHPDYLSFFNLIAGGPQRGTRFLADSNIDWGQDLKRLADYLHSPDAANREYTVRVFSFPSARLLSELNLDPNSLDAPPHGLLAISKNYQVGLVRLMRIEGGSEADIADYSWVQQHPRVARIGNSIDVYDLDR